MDTFIHTYRKKITKFITAKLLSVIALILILYVTADTYFLTFHTGCISYKYNYVWHCIDYILFAGLVPGPAQRFQFYGPSLETAPRAQVGAGSFF